MSEASCKTRPVSFARETQVLKEREERFHDDWAASIDPTEVMVDASWSAATCPEHRWIQVELGDVKTKRVLDLGCGAGEAAVWFAKQGAHVVASDLSAGFLDLVERVARLHGVQVETHQADADALGLPEASFDIVYAGNVLHHVDTQRTLDQIVSVLKPGGKLVSWDPLHHNFVIQIYRRMARSVRTEDEHPLKMGDLGMFRDRFSKVEHECFWFTTLWIFLRFYLVERVHPSQDRYWKRIIRDHERLAPIYRRYERFDQWVLKHAPFLKRYCWNLVVCATK